MKIFRAFWLTRAVWRLGTLAIAFAGLFSFGFGQNKVVDSLENLLAKASRAKRPELLNQLGKELLKSDLERAEALVLEARTLARQAGNSRELARSFQLEGNILIRENDYQGAIERFQSGLKVVKGLDPKTEASILSDQGFAYENLGDFSTALSDYQKALGLRQSVEDLVGIGLSYNNIGSALRAMGRYDEAIVNHRQALEIFKREGDEKGQSEALNNIGNVHYNWANYDSALNYFHKSLLIKEKLGNPVAIARTLNNIGGIHYELENYNKALEYFFRYLDIQRSQSNYQGIATSEVNIGLVYYDMKQFDLALRYYTDAMVWLEKINNEGAMALTLGNMGLVYLEKKEYQRALGYYHRALKLKEALADTFGLAQTNHQLGYTYFYLRNYEKALQYNLKGFEIAERNNLKKQLYESYLLFSEIHAAKGDFRLAYDFFTRYSEMKDSVVNTEKLAQIADIQTKYESSRKDKAITELTHEKQLAELQLDKHKLAIWIIVIAILLVAAVLWVLFSQWRMKNQRRQMELQFKNLEIEHRLVQSQMNPHFLFNALTSIQNYLVQDNNQPAIRHLSKFAALLRKILQNSRKTMISLSEELEALDLYMTLERLRDPGRFAYTIQVSDEIDTDEIEVPPMIIQPFVENCIKHAFGDRDREGHIDLRLWQEGQDLICIVEDNGRGRTKKDPEDGGHQSLGIQLIFDRISVYKRQGKVPFGVEVIDKVEGGEPCGTRVVIRFPI